MAYGEAIINSVDLAKNKMRRDSIEMNELPAEIRQVMEFFNRT